MNTSRVPHGTMGALAHAGDDLIWQHRALCQLALPMRSKSEPWSRHAGGSSLGMKFNPPEGSLPSGRFLRLVLLYVFDAAFRARSPVVPFGDSLSAWSTALGLSAADRRNLLLQLERLGGTRLEIATDGGPTLAVFDARSRLRTGGGPGGSGVRLNSRFLSGLLEAAVPLSRDAVRKLWREPESVDAYAWAVQGLHQGESDVHGAGWDELAQRFGAASQDTPAFRASFTAALRAAAAVDPSISVAVSDTDIEVRHAVPDMPLTSREPGLIPLEELERPHQRTSEPDPSREPPEPAGTQAAPSDRTGLDPGSAECAVVAALAPVAAALRPPGLADPVSLPPRQTGVPGVVWLRRGPGSESPLVGVTPGGRLDLERLTVLAVEPMILQVEGGLPERDFAQVSAWIMANRDVIDDVWEGRVGSAEELDARVQLLRTVPSR